MAVYELPELDYAYDALEPHIAAEIMELHHSKHHATYVAGANAALEALEKAREEGTNPDQIRALSKNLAFNLGGHTNHSVFWKNLSPNGGGELPANWLRLSTATSVLSLSSRITSTPQHSACRAPAGQFSATTTSPVAWLSSSSPTSRATSPSTSPQF